MQEYNINWEYVPGKCNIAADVLSRVNIQDQTFEGERETVAKVYHILKDRTELADIINKIKLQQKSDEKLRNICKRLTEQDDRITPYYCMYKDILFIKDRNQCNQWKLVIPKTIEKEITMDYHIRYGHMGAIKVIKTLEENAYFKDINRRVRSYIRPVSYTHLDVYKRQLLHFTNWHRWQFLMLLRTLLLISWKY